MTMKLQSLQEEWTEFWDGNYTEISNTLILTDALLKDLQTKQVITPEELQALTAIPESKILKRTIDFYPIVNDVSRMVPRLKTLVLCLKFHQCDTLANLLQAFAVKIQLDTSDWVLDLSSLEGSLHLSQSEAIDIFWTRTLTKINQSEHADFTLQVVQFCSLLKPKIPALLLYHCWPTKFELLTQTLNCLTNFGICGKSDEFGTFLTMHHHLQSRIRQYAFESLFSTTHSFQQLLRHLATLPLNQPENPDILETYNCLWNAFGVLITKLDDSNTAELALDLFDFLSYRDNHFLDVDVGPVLNALRTGSLTTSHTPLLNMKLWCLLLKAHFRQGHLDLHSEALSNLKNSMDQLGSLANTPPFAVIQSNLMLLAGLQFLVKENYKDAEHCLKEGISIQYFSIPPSPRSLETKLYFGTYHVETLRKLRKYPECLHISARTLDVCAENTKNSVASWCAGKVWEATAWAWLEQGHVENALRDYKKLLESHRFGIIHSLKLKLEVANMLVCCGSISAGAQIGREVLQMQPPTATADLLPFIKFHSANLSLLSGNIDEAVASLCEAKGAATLSTFSQVHLEELREKCENFKDGIFASSGCSSVSPCYSEAKQLIKACQFDRAETVLVEALEALERQHGPWARETFKIRNRLCIIRRNKAMTLVNAGSEIQKVEMTTAIMEQLVAMVTIQFRKRRVFSRNFLKYYHNLGTVLYCSGDTARALDLFRGLARLRAFANGGADSKTLSSRLWLGKALLRLNKYEEARTVLEAVLKVAGDRLEDQIQSRVVDEIESEVEKQASGAFFKASNFVLLVKWNLAACLFYTGEPARAQRLLHGSWLQLLFLRQLKVVF